VLGGRGGHHNDYIDHQHYDDAPNVIDYNGAADDNDGAHHHHHDIDLNHSDDEFDYEYVESIDNDLLDHDDLPDHDHGTVHHHHGPGDNDIVIHDHQYDRSDHDHNVTRDYNGTPGFHDKYGAANHQHDTADPAKDGATKRPVLRCLGCDEPEPSGARYCDRCWGSQK